MADRPEITIGTPAGLSPAGRPVVLAWELSQAAKADLEAIESAVIRHPDDPRLRGVIVA